MNTFQYESIVKRKHSEAPSSGAPNGYFSTRIHKRTQLEKANGNVVGDVVPLVAREIATESRLLCFDEFQITDIADAAILSRLMGGLWNAGVVTIATSNREPNDLYRGGLNWSTYIPGFVELLKVHP